MKRFFSMSLAALLLSTCLTGCGGSEADSPAGGSEASQQSGQSDNGGA